MKTSLLSLFGALTLVEQQHAAVPTDPKDVKFPDIPDVDSHDDLYGDFDPEDYLHGYEGDGTDYDDHFLKEWETLMHDFNPDLLVTVPVAARSDEFFYEDVPKVGTLLRGAYFVIGSEDDEAHTGVDFVVTDPNGAIVYERGDKVEGVFSYTANVTGTYSFMIGNHKWLKSKQVTFLVGVGQHQALKSHDLNPLTEGMSAIDSTLKEIQSESSYLWIKQKSHMKAVSSINSQVYWYYLFEFLVLVVVSSIQIYYIRGLLSNRRLF